MAENPSYQGPECRGWTRIFRIGGSRDTANLLPGQVFASAPDVLVEGVIHRLRALGASNVAELHGEPENMVFALPKELRLQLID